MNDIQRGFATQWMTWFIRCHSAHHKIGVYKATSDRPRVGV